MGLVGSQPCNVGEDFLELFILVLVCMTLVSISGLRFSAGQNHPAWGSRSWFIVPAWGLVAEIQLLTGSE